MDGLRDRLVRLIAVADDPADDDDSRLRKRVGVVAGYLTIFAPLSLPFQTPGQPLGWPLALSLSAYSATNLLVLARTRRFDRFVVALIATGFVFVPVATAVGGGLTGSSSGLIWGFLVPAYAIMALGPRRATPWFIGFLVMAGAMVMADPFIRNSFAAGPYPVKLFAQIANGVVPLTIVFLLLRYTDLRRREAEARADELLTNAIPPSIARRLRRGESRIAESYPETTVLFADIVGFTPWARRTAPSEVVELLDELFSRFDDLSAECRVEKIKTIGDAYMAVSGAPEPNPDHAEAALTLGRGILDAVADARRAHELPLEVRVGLASGAVVAGVIGQRRILFDLWGDTVNLAARMESSGVPGRIQVSASAHDLLVSGHAFAPREVEVKGMGPMTVFLLEDDPST
jgi:guanylate cyclase